MNTDNQLAGDWLAVAKAAMEEEARAILKATSRLDDSLTRAVDLILNHTGKVIVTGLGKSGHVGRKIVATLNSTGTPAVFLHPAEAVHGDLGIYQPGDPTILISKNGTTAELLRLVPILRQFQSVLIGILGNLKSPLAKQIDIVLDASVDSEADLHNLAPTSSSTVTMALGDALAIALMQARRFTPEDFARYHPAGQLGRNLMLRVVDVMHVGDEVAWVALTDSLREVVIRMSARPLGAACVVRADGTLEGLITDGDLRRALQKYDDIRTLRAADVMTVTPTTVLMNSTLNEALHLMENRPRQISVLPVIDDRRVCIGLVRLHDIYQGERNERHS